MEDKSRITGLYLENFMSIRGPIYLDIEPITLLYGPNSAGKSAISSAIKLISKFRTIGGRRTFVLNEEFNSELYGRLYRHDISNDMKLGVRFKIYEFSGPLYEIDQNILNISEYAFSDTFEDLSDFLYQRETGGFFTFEIFFSASCNAEFKSCHVCMDSIKEGGRPLIDANGCEGQVFYLDHPIMIAIDKQLKKFGTSFFKLLSAVYQNETHTVNNNKLETSLPFEIESDTLVYMEEHLFDSEKRVEKETQILDTLLRLITLLPLHHLYRLCDDMCHIGPLRHIPTDSQLTFLLKNLYEDKYHAYLTLDHLEFSWLDGTLAWKIIAENPLLNAYEHNIFGQQEFCLIDTANEWLNSEQRLGMQHKILPYIGIIKDPSRLTIPKNKSTENENIITNFPDRIVKLELEDCNLGIAVSVSSVGAGVPQIIPVIVAGLTEPNIFIEQPELHLHPKIQTELMDFFVSCLNGGGASFLIETHSEYLALRLLRRVRETHANQIKHHDFSITENKIAFYYFNKINGKTEIKRLRVSGDGEFLDRWPKGFFSERDIELFDEDD